MMTLSVGYANRLYRIPYALLMLGIIIILSGCFGGIKTIKPQYMSNFHATPIFDGSERLITLNAFYDERSPNDKIGEGYNAYGNKVEAWITENDPSIVIENAIVDQLRNSGFTVIRSKGWNYDPNSIPGEVKTRLIIGGIIKTFWVESRPNFWSFTINSKVSFNLFITDAMDKKIFTLDNSQAAHKAIAALNLLEICKIQ